MKYDELKALSQIKSHRHNRDIEHQIQVACIRWFNIKFPDLLLFAIPNGGKRDRITAAKMKAEGVLAGVADMMLPLARHGKYGLFIELKTEEKSSRQSSSQRMFEQFVTSQGYQYSIVRSLKEFINLMCEYIEQP